ncbi:hypothetical protein BV898_01836 [Hypsibius exemplaris]|uniref:Non-homologous end-joining factor 1 n=1 Tax=Hypsibius exemplaris TaxID=2072580 RepID=A0A1W0X9T9_HYPEX|nr:hypothetical protein BV898_01836 [Hypsibius exemplaris]
MTKVPPAEQASIVDAKFEAEEWHCHTVSAATAMHGEHDNHFGTFFSATQKSDAVEERCLWMKILTVLEESEDGEETSGFRFLAFDPSDGALWYQQAKTMPEISKKVQEFNEGLEFEDDVLLNHIDAAVRGKCPNICWRFTTERIMERGALVPTKILGFISCRAPVGKIALDFKFDCQKVRWEVNMTRQSFPLAHLVLPLYTDMHFLTDTTAELYRIIEKKDKEIEDYKNHGAKVSRKHLSTAPFDADAFTLTHIKTYQPPNITDTSHFLKLMALDSMVKKRRLDLLLEQQKNITEDVDAEMIDAEAQPSESKKARDGGGHSPVKVRAPSPVTVAPAASSSPSPSSETSTSQTPGEVTRKSSRKVVQKAASTQSAAEKPAPPKKKRGLF